MRGLREILSHWDVWYLKWLVPADGMEEYKGWWSNRLPLKLISRSCSAVGVMQAKGHYFSQSQFSHVSNGSNSCLDYVIGLL
jgi:hypothetical protein